MRILLTGAAGFVGRAVRAELERRGHEVVALDVLLPVAHSGGRPLPAEVSNGLHRVDVADEPAVRSLLAGVDAVCHQAAMVGLGVNFGDAGDYVRHNVTATTALLSAMTSAGVGRLVQASSMVVYGSGRQVCAVHGDVTAPPRTTEDLAEGRFDPRCPRCGTALGWGRVDEDAPTDPRNVYAATKLAQEHLATAWAEQAGGTAISLRYHNVYGPHLPSGTPYAGVASIFRSAVARGEAPRVYEDGGQLRDFVHVSDVARANRAALESLLGGTVAAGHRVFNVGSGEVHSILELAEALATAAGGPAPTVVGGGRPGDVRHIVADSSRLRRELGVSARTGFADGIRAFANEPLR